MIKRIYILLLIIVIVLLPFSILKISQDLETTTTNTIFKDLKIGKTPFQKINLNSFYEPAIGNIKISKINLNEKLYAIDSNNNDVSKHVSIMKESITPEKRASIMILAAHSGTGKVAYFEELDKLKLNDEIILNYQNINYYYLVKDIWEEKKTGYININRENKKQLILTTCSPKRDGYQLIINCIEKESN